MPYAIGAAAVGDISSSSAIILMTGTVIIITDTTVHMAGTIIVIAVATVHMAGTIIVIAVATVRGMPTGIGQSNGRVNGRTWQTSSNTYGSGEYHEGGID